MDEHHAINADFSPFIPDGLTPFILGRTETLSLIPMKVGGVVFERFEYPSAFQGAMSARFAYLLNIGNGLAYHDGMGMPEWVLLDCGLLPGLFVGLCRKAKDLSSDIRQVLDQALVARALARQPKRVHVEQILGIDDGALKDDELVPVSEFCAIPTLTGKEVVGYSLFSLEPRLGYLTKALGLSVLQCLRYHWQIGVVQWDNPRALKTHLKFGELEILDPLTSIHSRAGDTIIYRLRIPDMAGLIEPLKVQKSRQKDLDLRSNLRKITAVSEIREWRASSKAMEVLISLDRTDLWHFLHRSCENGAKIWLKGIVQDTSTFAHVSIQDKTSIDHQASTGNIS